MTSPFANMSREIFQYDECDQQQQCSVLQQLELQQDSLYSKLRSGQEAAASCDHKQQIKSDDWTSSGRRHCLDTMGTMHTSSSRCDSGVSILTLCTCLGSGSLGHKVRLLWVVLLRYVPAIESAVSARACCHCALLNRNCIACMQRVGMTCAVHHAQCMPSWCASCF